MCFTVTWENGRNSFCHIIVSTMSIYAPLSIYMSHVTCHTSIYLYLTELIIGTVQYVPLSYCTIFCIAWRMNNTQNYQRKLLIKKLIICWTIFFFKDLVINNLGKNIISKVCDVLEDPIFFCLLVFKYFICWASLLSTNLIHI